LPRPAGLVVLDRVLVASCVFSETRIRSRGAAWSRAAVLTTSPVAIVSPASGRPRGHERFPVVIPTRSSILLVGEVANSERGPYGTFGIVLVGNGSAKERHDRIPDELFDRTAVALVFANARWYGARTRQRPRGPSPPPGS
jgi:hypothetical protein